MVASSVLDALLFDWPFVGLAAGLLGLVALALWPRPQASLPRWRDPSWLVCLMLPIYMVHQFEEHGVNLLGQRFHFLSELCGTLGHAALDGCPASPSFIFAVNVGGGVWIPGLLAIVWRNRNVMVGASAFGVPLVNALAHIGPGLVKGTYNSGVVTAVLLFVPVCGWVLLRLRQAGCLDGRRLAAVIGSGVGLHGLLLASLVAHERGLISQGVLLTFNVAYGFFPLAVGAALPVPPRAPASQG